MDWLLMNRDTPLLYFCSSIDLYGDTLVQEKAWLSPLRPLGYPGLWKFLTRRRASTHRKNMGRILADCGCRTLEGFLLVSHAASLNDTFWVKEAASPLCWAEVSLYANAFDPDIAAATLTGSGTGTASICTRPAAAPAGGKPCPKRWPPSWPPFCAAVLWITGWMSARVSRSPGAVCSPRRRWGSFQWPTRDRKCPPFSGC